LLAWPVTVGSSTSVRAEPLTPNSNVEGERAMAHVNYRDPVPTATAEATVAFVRGLRGKNVLVTGGTSGIGQATAIRFAEYGANVAINYLGVREEATETEERVHACLARVRQTGVRMGVHESPPLRRCAGVESSRHAPSSRRAILTHALARFDVLSSSTQTEFVQPRLQIAAGQAAAEVVGNSESLGT
jgi:hypothetical protein